METGQNKCTIVIIFWQFGCPRFQTGVSTMLEFYFVDLSIFVMQQVALNS